MLRGCWLRRVGGVVGCEGDGEGRGDCVLFWVIYCWYMFFFCLSDGGKGGDKIAFPLFFYLLSVTFFLCYR